MANWFDIYQREKVEREGDFKTPPERGTIGAVEQRTSRSQNRRGPLEVPDWRNPDLWTSLTDVSYLIDVGYILDKKRKEKITKDLGAFIVSTLSFILASAYADNREIVQILETFTNIFSTFLSKRLWFYIFHINPSEITFTERKIQNVHQYGWGFYDLEHYGNSLTVITARGTTGLLLPPKFIQETLVSAGLKCWAYDARLSIPYIKLNILHKLYKESSQSFLFIYYGKAYFGFFESFSFNQSAENPRKINYEFTFNAWPKSVFNIFQWEFSGIREIRHLIDPSSLRETIFLNTSKQYETSSS